jgi:hypothetical protein
MIPLPPQQKPGPMDYARALFRYVISGVYILFCMIIGIASLAATYLILRLIWWGMALLSHALGIGG